jgi:hypothetical protein
MSPISMIRTIRIRTIRVDCPAVVCFTFLIIEHFGEYGMQA